MEMMTPLTSLVTLRKNLRKDLSVETLYGQNMGESDTQLKLFPRLMYLPILKKTLFRTIGDTEMVKWYGAVEHSKLNTVNVDCLSENKVDAARLSVTPNADVVSASSG